jgi:hypothetical protein
VSAVPPNIVGPILQVPVQQQQTAQAQDADHAHGSEKSRLLAQRADQAEHAVEDTDGDTVVHADAGGGGGPGRAFSESPEQPSSQKQEEGEEGVRRGPDGQVHIDIQA